MYDTLILNNHQYEPLEKKTRQPTKDSICEPDNGHKKETLNLRIEADRLKTFENWPNAAVTPETLAKAGFYYLNTNYDLVRCAFCNAEVCRWESGDNPMDEHMKWSPNCPFVKEKRKPQMSLPTLFSALPPPGQDVCGNGEFFPNSVPEDETFKLLKQMIRSHEDFKSRLETFSEWPKSLKQKPIKLAEAGFYYKGVGDQCICFHCGGGLKDWEDNDDPWEQHALWFPKCNFLITSKGQEFIDEVRNRLRPEESSVPNSNLSTKEKPAEIINNEQGANASGDDKLCKICYNNAREVVFIPCGHLLACINCSLSLKNICPVCRKRFEATMRVFPS